jgi:hypothetical protein
MEAPTAGQAKPGRVHAGYAKEARTLGDLVSRFNEADAATHGITLGTPWTVKVLGGERRLNSPLPSDVRDGPRRGRPGLPEADERLDSLIRAGARYNI